MKVKDYIEIEIMVGRILTPKMPILNNQNL